MGFNSGFKGLNTLRLITWKNPTSDARKLFMLLLPVLA